MKLLICLFIMATAIHARSQSSTDEREVTNAVEALRKAMVDADRAALEKLTADQLSYGHSSGKVDSKETFVNGLATGESDFETITLSEQKVEVSDKVAIVRHRLSGNTRDKGKSPGSVNIGVLLVWYKFGTEWKLVARQAFKL